MVQVTPDVGAPGDNATLSAVPGAAGASTALTHAVAALSAAPFDAAVGAASGLLDLHEGIATPPRIADPRLGCLRWPEHLWLLNQTTGELVRGRCRATNLCPYCRTLAVIETAEMLLLDAAEWAPSLLLTLTAREHLTRADCRLHLAKLHRSLRKRWPIEWHCQVEFQKRGALHLHLLVKGVPVDDQEQLLDRAGGVWCARVDAEMAGQSVKEITGADGLVRYLQKELAHGLKKEQAPPIGWRGHRTSQTRGYLVRPASVMRQEARESLRLDRALWRAHRAGHEGEQARQVAELELTSAAADWRLFSQSLKRAVNPPSASRAEGL